MATSPYTAYLALPTTTSRSPSPAPSSSSLSSASSSRKRRKLNHDDDGGLLQEYEAMMARVAPIAPDPVPTPALDPPPAPAPDQDGDISMAVTEEEAGPSTGGGGATGAKRRKMDKKKLKREEQKAAKATLVESADFRIFGSQPVKEISLLPKPDVQWTTANPGHTLLEGDELRERKSRIGIEGVVVDGQGIREGAAAWEVAQKDGQSRRWNKRIIAAPRMSKATSSPTLLHLTLPLPPTTTHSKPTLLHPTSPYLPPTQKKILLAHASSKTGTASSGLLPFGGKPLTRAERKDVDKWRAERDARMGVKTRSAVRGGEREGVGEGLKVAGEVHVVDLDLGEKGEVGGKKQKRKEKMVRVARYWAPEVGVGGKARGYGWGYERSKEGTREGLAEGKKAKA